MPAAVNTYKHQSEVTALERLEEVRHPGLQTAADEHTVADVVQEDGSESVHVLWN